MNTTTNDYTAPVRVVSIESEKIPQTQDVINVVESEEPPRIVNLTVYESPRTNYVVNVVRLEADPERQ